MSKHENAFKTLYLYVIEAIGTLRCQSKGFRVFYKALGDSYMSVKLKAQAYWLFSYTQSLDST